jgi:alkanesulfonate monooxygenase SsuD/methylene tetrahydromethanopterin reductase-like flavin-dependent oxidoreductase (luciferase family)
MLAPVTSTNVSPPRDIRFGYFLVPNADDPLLETARRVEQLGLDYVGIQDHPYQRRFVETWSLMAMIAATTTTLRIFPDVANLPLRPPAVLAKTAATIDLQSGGRFEVGLGAGAFWAAIEAYGGPRRGAFHGPVDQWVDGLAELVAAYGFDTFLFWGEGDRQLERFATDVVPATRDALA